MHRLMFAAVALTMSAPVLATVLVSNLAEPTRQTTPIDVNLWAAQSFATDGSSAAALSSIRAILGNQIGTGSIVAELRAGTTSGALLTSFTVPDLSGALAIRMLLPDSFVLLNSASTYWLILGATGAASFGWSYAEGNGYTGNGTIGGYSYSSDQGASWGSNGTDNPYQFAVDVSAVPEPAAWAVLTLGFAIVGGRVRARRDAPLARAG